MEGDAKEIKISLNFLAFLKKIFYFGNNSCSSCMYNQKNVSKAGCTRYVILGQTI